MDHVIYLDNAATTRVRPQVVSAMLPCFTEQYGNPSGVYSVAQGAHALVDSARETLAAALGARANEIYFTAGGSEADNWALKAAAEAYGKGGGHIITSKIEHHAVLRTCEYLEKHGYEVTYLDVDDKGFVNPEQLEAAIRPETILVSIMFANNEIGTIEPVRELARIAHAHGVLFHTDAVQAYGHVPIDVRALGIDLMSVSGHKLNGPKGIGFLYIRNGVKIDPLIHGGSQERGKRAGTSNVPGIIGLGRATELAAATMDTRANYERALRDHLIARVEQEIPYVRLNGDRTQRLPNNTSFCFRFIEGESLLILLNQAGICGSSGSACTSGSLDPSHVLLAIGLPHEIAHGSLRLTLSEETTKEEIDYTVEELKNIITRLREMSPLYEDFRKKHPEG